jgi:Na+/melibiose symporter-like transporter
MTPNPKDRMSVGLWQEYGKRWSGDFLFAMMLPLLDFARAGYIHVSQGVIFAGFGVFGALMGTTGSMMMAIHCRERIMLQPQPAATTKTLFYILKNKYAMRNFIAGLAGSWWSRGGYSWDMVTQLEIWGGVFRSAPWNLPRMAVQVVSISLIERFKKMFGGSYRKTVIMMRFWDMLCGLGAALIGLSPKVIGNWWLAGIVYAVSSSLNVLNDAPSNVMDGEINREINDYTEYMTGERPDGTIGLLTGLIQKVTDPLKALFTIAVFKWTGYDPNIASDRRWTQDVVRENSTMYSRVFFLYLLGDIIPSILRTIPYFFYDLEGKKRDDMYAALNERRAMIAKDDELSAEMAAMVEMMAEEEMAEQNT